MAGNSLVVEQAQPLAPPTEHSAELDNADDIIDLDAGDSLLDSKPDDGKDTADGGVAPPSPEKSQDEDQEPTEEVAEDEEEDELAALAAAEPEPEKRRLSGSAKLKARLAEANAEIERLRHAVPKTDDATEFAASLEREIGPPPKESDYADYVAYDRACTVYETSKAIVGRELKKNAEAAKSAIEQHNATIVDTFKERVNDVRKSIKDFDDVVNKATVSPNNRDTILLILESDKGPQLSYYLAKHPEKVHELNALSPRRQAAEIGRLEARLSTVAPKKETKAPPPVAPLKGGMTSTDKDPEKMSMDEFSKWFDQKKKANGG
jgi:hypothetical protein